MTRSSSPLTQPQATEPDSPEETTGEETRAAELGAETCDDEEEAWEDPGFKHSRFLEELIDEGYDCVMSFYADAVAEEKSELRVHLIKLALRGSDTIRSLISTFDRHEKDRAKRAT